MKHVCAEKLVDIPDNLAALIVNLATQELTFNKVSLIDSLKESRANVRKIDRYAASYFLLPVYEGCDRRMANPCKRPFNRFVPKTLQSSDGKFITKISTGNLSASLRFEYIGRCGHYEL